MNWELVAFVLYFVLVLFIGFYFFLRSKGDGEKEYFLGGRSMGPWVTAMSAQASDMSGWLLMGLPGSILAFGLGQAWIGIGLALGTAANWLLVAKRLRCFSKEANDAITLPQYLSNRFQTANPALQIICAVIFLIFFTVYVASAFVTGGTVFAQVIPQLAGKESTAMLIFAIIIILYTLLGGYRAVCWTDFFQGLMMMAALVSVPLLMVCVGRFDASLAEQVIVYKDTSYSFTANLFSASWQEIITGLTWGLGYFGMPHILVRFMSIRSAKLVRKSSTVALVWLVLSLGAALVMAYLGRLFILSDGTSLAEKLLSQGMQKAIFIELARDLFPAFIAGLLLSAIIAASMSTADSQLLVASSSFTSDIYKPVLRKNASNKETLWVGRIVTLLVAVVAYFIASSKGSGAQAIMNMVDNAWGGFGASFGPVILLSLFWKRLTYKGAIAGVVGGAIVDVLWLVYLTDATGIYELLPGFIIGFICAIVVSLMDKAPAKEVTDLFDRAVAAGKSNEE